MPRSTRALLDRGANPHGVGSGETTRDTKDRIGTLATWVGCLAGIIALPTVALKACGDLTGRRAKLCVSPGGVLGVAWDPTARRWRLTYGLSLDNQGDASDSVRNARAYLDGPSSRP